MDKICKRRGIYISDDHNVYYMIYQDFQIDGPFYNLLVRENLVDFSREMQVKKKILDA